MLKNPHRNKIFFLKRKRSYFVNKGCKLVKNDRGGWAGEE